MTSRFYISAAHKSSGKTTLSIGLAAAYAQLDNKVQCFKKGPDYIDPLWLTKASGKACYNLDFNSQSDDEILTTYQHHLAGADIAFVEGNKGLFDGVALDGSNANAAMAKLLNLPVVLVINCQGFSRGIAPLLLGYQQFDPALNYAGVILNQVGGSRHEQKLIAATEHYTDFNILGVVQRDPQLVIPERHLGLVPANESQQAMATINYLAAKVRQSIDLDSLKQVTQSETVAPPRRPVSRSDSTIKVAVARDAAFGFYYPDDLEAMQALGAEVIFFDTMKDSHLPAADALFIGGGFPETHLKELARNQSMLDSIKQAIEAGLPTYAECGGLMYLCDSIAWQGSEEKMVGVIPASIEMHSRPQGRGQVVFQETQHMPWPERLDQPVCAHEFHYAQLHPKEPLKFAYSVQRGYGIDGDSDGVLHHNLLASFIHRRHTSAGRWVDRFLTFARQRML
jgi:cobyrinic acid a,c-diamide synthase